VKIIDAHLHPDRYHDDKSGPFQPIEYLIDYMDALGVERTFALGDVLRFGPRPSNEQIRSINDTNWANLEKYPDRLIGLCFIHSFNDADFCQSEIDRCILNGPFIGIKCEYPNASSPDLDKWMPMADEHQLVVLQHAWDISWRMDRRDLQTDPCDVATLARRYPNVKILMAHLTGCGLRGVREIAESANVWVDTSGSQPFAHTIEDALSVLGPDRILFGPDCPMRDLAAQLGRILDADIPETARRKILYHNAVDLFSLKDR
jgi:hypothetical protein